MPPKRVKARMEPSNIVDIGSPEFKTDEFRMYGLKILDCSRRYSHDWTTCPFAHPKEKARRRDPRTHNYAGVACPFVKQSQQCPYGDHCPYAHNVFEYWLHPTRYRTQLCNIAASCSRTVCFFAHTIEELRVPLLLGPSPNLLPTQLHSQPQNLNPFVHSSTDLAGVDSASQTMALEPQAKYILERLMASRQLSAELQSSPVNDDVSEIQMLISLLQHQQAQAGVSDHNPDLQLNFLNALLHSLSNVICSSIMQSRERERLTKLINWMYVQMIQNRQSLFSTDSMTPFSSHQPDPMQGPLLHQLGEAIQSRHSLSSIPEMAEAASQYMTLQGRPMSVTSQLSPSPNLDPLQYQHFPVLRSTSLDGASFGFGREMRMSDESASTRISGPRTSGSFSLHRSSADSESLPRASRNVRSQDSSRMSWEDPNTPPEFIFQEWLQHNNPTHAPSGSQHES